MTLPNVLTLSRILAIPLVLALWGAAYPTAALVCLGVSLSTDLFDGMLARALNQTTPLGALLDPVADKANVLALLPLLYVKGEAPGWYCALVVTRNVAQLSVIPVLMWWLKIPFHVKPRFLPRFATALSFILLWIFMERACFPVPWPLGAAGLLSGLILGSAGLEAYILATFLPRFVRIMTRAHDTFE